MGDTVTIFDPQGNLGEIPADQLQAAVKAGGKPAVNFKDPDGNVGYVPADKIHEATLAGGEIQPFEQQDTKHPSFWEHIIDSVQSMFSHPPSGVSPYGGMDLEEKQREAQQAAEQSQSEKEAGYSPAYRAVAPLAAAVGTDVPGMEQAAKEGDVSGVAARAAVPAALAVAPLVSEAAYRVSKAAGRSVADTGGRAVDIYNKRKTANAVYRDATLSKTNIPEYAGEEEPETPPVFSKTRLGPEDTERGTPLLTKEPAGPAAPSPELQKSTALATAETPEAKPTSQTGEALGTLEAPEVKPEPKPLPVRDPATGRMKSALKQPARDLVDSVIDPGESPAKNLQAKSAVEFYLNKGDVEKAQAALDAVKLPKVQTESGGAMKVTDSSAMETINRDLEARGINPPKTVGTTEGAKADTDFFAKAKASMPDATLSEQMQEAQRLKTVESDYPSKEPITAPQEKGLARDPNTGRVLNKADSDKFRKVQDKLEDKGIVQDLDEGLTKEGRRAYRQFIKDNSPMTKAELTDQVDQMPGWGRENAIPKAKPDTKFAGKNAGPQAINDLTEILERSRRQAELMKQAGASKGAIQEMQAKKLPVRGGSQMSDAEGLRAASEKQFNEDMKKPNVEPFFSKAAWVTDEKIPNATSGDAALSTLRNAGVKEGEIKWMGLDDYLKGKAKVSRADIQGYIKEHEIKLGEMNKGETKRGPQVGKTSDFPSEYDDEKPGDELEMYLSEATPKMQKFLKSKGLYLEGNKIHYNPDNFGDIRHVTEKISRELDEGGGPTWDKYGLEGDDDVDYNGSYIDLAMEKLQGQHMGEKGQPKYSQYTLPGEKSNYTEKLLTLPEKKSVGPAETAYQDFVGKMREKYGNNYASSSNYLLKEEAQRSRLANAARIENAGSTQNFKSGHFDEPNVLAHVRYDDRVDAAGKKTLFLEEVQSDWHQKGKREGYQDTANKLSPEEEGEYQKLKGMSSAELWDMPNGMNRWQELMVKHGDAAALMGVPDAPFKTDWHELVMKRMLREAAEKGYDKLAWTTGEQQAERYDLSKQVSSIHYFPEENRLIALNHDGNSAIDKIGVKPEKLQDYIGKDVAKKLLQAPLQESDEFEHPNQKLAGNDLKVGGEWAKRLYDQAIPNFLNKYAKKWGAKVGTTTIEQEHDASFNESFESATRAKQILDSGGEVYGIDHHGHESLLKKDDDLNPADWQAYVMGDKQPSTKVHSIDITPEMRRDVLKKGQPIAAKEEPREMVNA